MYIDMSARYGGRTAIRLGSVLMMVLILGLARAQEAPSLFAGTIGKFSAAAVAGEVSDNEVLKLNADSGLPYGMGGEFSTPRKAVYVDAVNGDDSNPGTLEKPFKTGSAENLNSDRYGPGSHILFKRGQTHRDVRFWLSEIAGTEANPIVVGAYGSGERPKLSPPDPSAQKEIIVSGASHIMIRDLELGGIALEGGANNITLYNLVFGGDDNGNVVATSDTSRTAIVSSSFKELRSSDHINIHETPKGSGHLRDGWWVIDNDIDCSSNAEDCIDLYDTGVPTKFQDIKIVGNRIRGNGSRGPLILGNMAKYVWIVGNTATAGQKFGFHLGQGLFRGRPQPGQYLEYIQISGNMMWGRPSGDKPVFRFWRLKNSRVEWNTAINTGTEYARSSGAIEMDPAHQGPGNTVEKNLENFSARLPHGLSTPPLDPSPPAQSRSIAAELPSVIGPFHPNTDRAPGAFDSKGNRRGMVIEAFPELGTGWKGPPIVQKRMHELGIEMR